MKLSHVLLWVGCWAGVILVGDGLAGWRGFVLGLSAFALASYAVLWRAERRERSRGRRPPHRASGQRNKREGHR